MEASNTSPCEHHWQCIVEAHQVRIAGIYSPGLAINEAEEGELTGEGGVVVMGSFCFFLQQLLAKNTRMLAC